MTTAHADLSRRLLRGKVHAVFRHLPRALTGDEDAVHEMRVAGRRLRVALPLLALRPEGRRVRRAAAAVKDLTRAAGVSRDLDVMLASLEAELPPLGERSRPQAQILGRLRSARRRARARMAESVLDLDIRRLRRDLRVILGRGSDPALAVLARIRRAEATEADELLGILNVVGEQFEPVALHRMRIRLRRLRYEAELEAELSRQPFLAEEGFKALQDGLGRIRDLFLLSHWLTDLAARPAARAGATLVAEIRCLEQHFLERSRAEHRSFLAENPRGRLARIMAQLGHRNPAA